MSEDEAIASLMELVRIAGDRNLTQRSPSGYEKEIRRIIQATRNSAIKAQAEMLATAFLKGAKP